MKNKSENPSFAILRHAVPDSHFPDSHLSTSSLESSATSRKSHWDLLFESEGVLLTWAVENDPLAHFEQNCQKLFDHRLLYLDYEGPISNDRGEVHRVTRGEILRSELALTKFVFQVASDRLKGTFHFESLGSDLDSLSNASPEAEEADWKVRFDPHESPHQSP